MVSTADLKVYKQDASGGTSGALLPSATPNNIFTNVPQNELAIGEDYYQGVFFKNTHATESMDNFKLWLSNKSLPRDTELKWALDPIVTKQVPLLSFDGVDDYVDCTNDATLWSQSLTKFSFSFWIYATAGWDTNNRRVINHGGTSSSSFRVEIDDGTVGEIKFMLRDAVPTSFQASATTLLLNKWNFVVCTYDNTLGSANAKIYVNSVVGDTTGDSTAAINGSHILQLGEISNDYKGYMKDFRWWTTKALSQTEVTALYNDTDDVSPDYRLPLSEGTGNPVDEISGTKVGTLTNGTAWINQGRMQTTVDKYTAPINVTWNDVSSPPSIPNGGTLKPTEGLPVWLWLHVTANSEARLDDNALFEFEFDIPQGGTGTPGDGGTGGNPPPVATNYKVALAGDWGCEPETDDVIDLINTNGYDHICGVGDNAYESPACWTSRFNSLKSKMNSAYGNHEYSETGGTTPYKSFFGHSLTYFTYKFQNIQFFIIDTNIDCDVGSAQHNAIKAALEASQNDNTVTWRIAVFHHPMWGASSDHSYNDANTRGNFATLFVTNHVNFVVTGHNHNWQRTHMIRGTSSTPTVVDSTAPYTRSAEGFIHVVTGTGGHDSGGSLYSLGTQPTYQAYQNRTMNGVWEIVASNSGNTLTCSFVEVGGDKFDTFTITA